MYSGGGGGIISSRSSISAAARGCPETVGGRKRTKMVLCIMYVRNGAAKGLSKLRRREEDRFQMTKNLYKVGVVKMWRGC
jgi:hypothetical protein